MGLIARPSVPIPIPELKGGYAIAANLSIGKDEVQVGLGLGIGVKVSVISTVINESISLTDKQYDQVDSYYNNNAMAYGGNAWTVNSAKEVRNEQGQITGYQGTLSVGNKSTGIEMFSPAKIDEKGNSINAKLWASKSYIDAAKKVEDKK